MYAVTEALASTISGAEVLSEAVAEGDFDAAGGREGGEGEEEMEKDDVDDGAEDAGSCGYKDAGSSIATFRKSSSRVLHVFDGASVLASSIDADASSNDSTV